MAIGEYTLAKQRGSSGYYVKICLELMEQSDGDLIVEFASNIHTHWRPAVYFGVAYAWEHYLRTNNRNGGVKVQITELDWQIGDSTNAGVAFATVHAFWKALGFIPESAPLFDIE